MKKKLKTKCKLDGNCEFIMYGPGVEKIFDEVKEIFPNKKIKIFSSDYLKKKKKQKIYLKKLKKIKLIF